MERAILTVTGLAIWFIGMMIAEAHSDSGGPWSFGFMLGMVWGAVIAVVILGG